MPHGPGSSPQQPSRAVGGGLLSALPESSSLDEAIRRALRPSAGSSVLLVPAVQADAAPLRAAHVAAVLGRSVPGLTCVWGDQWLSYGPVSLPPEAAHLSLAARLGVGGPTVRGALAALDLSWRSVPVEVASVPLQWQLSSTGDAEAAPSPATGGASAAGAPGATPDPAAPWGDPAVPALLDRLAGTGPLLLGLAGAERLGFPLALLLGRWLQRRAPGASPVVLLLLWSRPDGRADWPLPGPLQTLAALVGAAAWHEHPPLQPLPAAQRDAALRLAAPALLLTPPVQAAVEDATAGRLGALDELLGALEQPSSESSTPAPGPAGLARLRWSAWLRPPHAPAGLAPDLLADLERVVAAGALYGRVFPWDVVALALGLERERSEELADLVDDLLEGPGHPLEDLGAREHPFAGRIAYRFRDGPTHATALVGAPLNPGERMTLLGALAESTERLFPLPGPALCRTLASLWTRADQPGRAAPWWLDGEVWASLPGYRLWQELSAAHAEVSSAHSVGRIRDALLRLEQRGRAGGSALDWRRAALDLVEALAPAAGDTAGGAQAAVLHQRGWVAMDAEDYEGARTHFASLDELLQANDGDPGSLAAARSGLGLALLRLGRGVEAGGHLELAHDLRVEVLGPHHPHTLLTAFLFGQAQHAAANPEGLTRMEHALGGLERILGPRHPEVVAASEVLAGMLGES